MSAYSKYFDQLIAIRRLVHQLKTKVEFYHIYRHQDNSKTFDDLPQDAQLNTIVDGIAQREFDHAHEHSILHRMYYFTMNDGWLKWAELN